MKCTMRIATCSLALLVFSVFSIRDAVAEQITLNISQPLSTMTLSGFFGGNPFLAQDGQAGTTDYDPASPSLKTTYQGGITIDVDNLLAPTSIKLISSTANADPSGKWLPEAEPYVDGPDANSTPGDFPDDAFPSTGTTPGGAGGAIDADYGFRINPGAPAAWGAYRDVEFNVTTPGFVPVNGLGEFSSVTENFEFSTGWFDYWLSPIFTPQKIRQRLELAGGDEDNALAAVSTYTVTPIGGGASLVTLTIPINYDIPDDTAPTHHTGVFVATVVIPEPTSFVLIGLALVPALMARRRK
jgi:hypothetical protein